MRYPPSRQSLPPTVTKKPSLPAPGDLAHQKAQADALKRHKPKRSPSGEFPAAAEK